MEREGGREEKREIGGRTWCVGRAEVSNTRIPSTVFGVCVCQKLLVHIYCVLSFALVIWLQREGGKEMRDER